jgi:hypothetical protein
MLEFMISFKTEGYVVIKSCTMRGRVDISCLSLFVFFGWLVENKCTANTVVIGKENEIKNRSKGNKCITKFCSVTEKRVK